MINIASLSTTDRGRWVIYRAHPDHVERGRIMTWSNQFVYVVYRCAGQWDRFEDYMPAPTLPEDLEFA
jgi:hypothetical protein